MSRPRLALAASLAVLAAGCSRGPSTGSVGDLAPDLHLDKLLQADAPSLPSLASLRGKVVVLEFWATWCPPCVESIPHLNELVEKMKGRPLQFISISDEDEADVAAFLKKRPISGWVAAEAPSAFQAFHFRSRPHTVLIDAKGNVAAVTFAEQVTPETLEQLLAGKRPTGLFDTSEGTLSEQNASSQPSLASIRISSSSKGAPIRWSVGDYSLELSGLPLRTTLSQVYDLPQSLIRLDPALEDAYYDVEASVPRDAADKFKPLVRQALEAAAGLTVRKVTETRDAYVLRSTGKPRLRPAQGSHYVSSKEGSIRLSNQRLDGLWRFLEASLDRPLVDETGMKGSYDIELEWDLTDKASLAKAFRAQLGLELDPAKRRLDVLVVSRGKVVK